jgi:DNA-directed RNA polymerase subunit RPC12/RpoP
VFCSHCGEELPEEAYFCLKCGAMTSKGVEAGVPSPWKWDKEVEKTLSTVAKELEQTFDNVRENIQKALNRKAIICPHCGGKNLSGGKFCYRCGKELT